MVDDPEPPADPRTEASVRHLELDNEDITQSFETRSRCPAGFAKRNLIRALPSPVSLGARPKRPVDKPALTVGPPDLTVWLRLHLDPRLAETFLTNRFLDPRLS
ncbi:hypothetical protein TNCV_4259051 [Trichonephila clavipes]|nr:hypothetical protein TNCV_4259051 [Trichonephila clavipes]